MNTAWDPSCKSCTGPTNSDCTECQKNATHIYYRHEGTCLDTCPTRFYGSSVNQECNPCHEFCTECYGSKSTECTVCDIQNRYTYVSPDTCQYLECPDLTYYDDTTYSCKPWNSLCKNCKGSTAYECLSCPYSKFLASDGSWKACSDLYPGMKFEPLTNTCLETCGKGFNLGFIGNLLSIINL